MSKPSKNPAKAYEWQFDGLVGPTHNYAGLSYGNIAATSNAGNVSTPQLAALQGIEKMRFVRDLGMKQAFIPPHYRPVIPALKRVGFDGGTSKVLEDAARVAPQLLASVFSSAFMWAANAATVAPSRDTTFGENGGSGTAQTGAGKIHLTPANLISNFHRSLEAVSTTRVLKRIFSNSQYFFVHEPLPAASLMADEGAANHMLSAPAHGELGLHIFVYGNSEKGALPSKYPARQTRTSCEAIARNHGLSESSCLFLQQNPHAIDLGIFHNDVIAMSTTRVVIAHQDAYTNATALREALNKFDITYIEVPRDQLSVEQAVSSYFFNSQLLDPGDGRLILVAPSECREQKNALRAIESLTDGNGPVSEVHYLDVRESMRNGGGPACLRLRVTMTVDESGGIHQGVIATDARLAALSQWVKMHYRDRLSFDDLRDPSFITELNEAYEALERIIEMPHLYDL